MHKRRKDFGGMGVAADFERREREAGCGLPTKSVVNLGDDNTAFDCKFQSTVTYCLFPSC